MTAHDPDVRALRDALMPAIERDLARGRRLRSRLALPLAVLATAAAGTGVAAATGVIFAEPKVPAHVPAVPEWEYFSTHPWSPDGEGGPVLMRPKPEALDRTLRALEAKLADRGITARCGEDEAHPQACYLPSGDLVPAEDQFAALRALDGPELLESSKDNYEIRFLTEEEARRWLCEHPRHGHPEDAQGC